MWMGLGGKDFGIRKGEDSGEWALGNLRQSCGTIGIPGRKIF